MGEDLCACDVDVVGVHEAVSQGDFSGLVGDVEGCAGVVDQCVETAWVGGDGLECLGDGVVACKVDLERFDGVGGV